ncbi:hypothetical protein ACGFYP_00320 [Streptomyces sp. NPDC048370]|uniref:hypothetical protein n=1 Tax=Streptomyces sp. NPDC048370 TaxID=3365540 RepID=UPI0037202E77
MAVYAQSEFANLLVTSELQRRLTEADSPAPATAAHPGMAGPATSRRPSACGRPPNS